MNKPAICGGTPVRETRLYYGHQYIDEADIQSVVEVLRSDYLTCGPKITELLRPLPLQPVPIVLCTVALSQYLLILRIQPII